jgi:glyoxylase-like metal-dependent hydrolase (beta-lactamase superfamily II)
MLIQRIGTLEVCKIFEMEQSLPMGMAFTDVTLDDLEQLRPWYTDKFIGKTPQESQVNLSVHTFLVRCRGRNILIDTCNGNHKPRAVPFAHQLNIPYLERLASAGLTPADVDVVLCTHLHGDHVGWNTQLRDGRWVPTFPNARYFFTQPDVEYFGRHLDDPFHGPPFTDSVLPIIEAGQANIVETNHIVDVELGEGIWLEGAPGHSPGSCIIHAHSKGARGIFSGDVFHHPIELVRPSMHFFADFDAPQAARTRREIFDAYVDTDTIFFPAHFADPTAGFITTRGNGFAYRFVD